MFFMLVEDYIAIAKDFSNGMKNPTFTRTHEYMMVHRPQGIGYIKKGRSVGWVVDLVFLDLPFGGICHGTVSSPPWDSISEDHVRYGIALAASTIADFGWVLIMASIGGNPHFIFYLE